MAALAIFAAVAAVAAPLGTEFTYQGVFTDAGTPASGVFDFRFILYDAEVGGSQVGSIVTVDDLAVSDGRVSAQLDFGPVFDGTALWLEVAVRDGASTGAYTVLSPRQELTAAPFAQHAQDADHATTADSATSAGSAGFATTAGDADTLDGQHGAYYLAWSNLVGVPPGLDDGDDDTLADLGCATDEIARWNGSAWSCSEDDDTPFVRTYVVGPVGTPLENGAALEYAMSNIPPPVSQETSVVVKIEPGVYDFGSGPQGLLSWSVIEGSGREVTRLTSSHCGTGVYTGTFWSTSEHVTLRRLTIENTCGDDTKRSIAVSSQGDFLTIEETVLAARGLAQHNHALFSSGADLAVSDTTLDAINGTDTNQGLVNRGGGASLFDVAIEALGGEFAHGVDNGAIGLSIRQSKIEAVWGNDENIGILVQTDADNLRLEDSTINTTFGSATERYGIRNYGADMLLRNVNISGNVAIGMHNLSAAFATLQLFDVYAYASETALWVEDTFDSGCMALVDDGRYDAATDAVVNVGNSCDVRIGGAYLVNGVTGAATCAGVYDWSHTFYPNTCPP
jgi:hypothetical protein